ncbi:MAG: hypothetical protein JNK82_30320 [Myxococcaceae bacterium]|nr:hypothetical protein [Myxococcaceae bacterium]
MLLAVLLEVAAAAAAPVALALPGLNAVNLAEGEGALYAELLAQRLGTLGLKVTTSRDVGLALGLERQRGLVGCSDAACMAELAGALGVDGIVMGDVAKLGAAYVVTLKVISKSGQSLAQFNADGPDARPLLHEGGRVLARQLSVALSLPQLDPGPYQVERRPLHRGWVKPVGIGVVGLGIVGVAAAVGCTLAADANLVALRSAATVEEADFFRDEGKFWQIAGGTLFGAGSVLIAAGALLLLLGDPHDDTLQPSAGLVPGGATFGLTGRWP